MAILAGDTFFAEAFRLLLSSPMEEVTKLSVIEEVVTAVGTDGVIGGQVMDIISEGEKPTQQRVEYIHTRKTGRLIRCCLRVGSIGAYAPQSVVDTFGEIGADLGLAFQIVDDILDETAEETALGKKVKKDIARGKCTYVRVHGLDRAREDARSLADRAKQKALETFGEEKAIPLLALADFVVERAH